MEQEKKLGHFEQDPMTTEVVNEGQWGVFPYDDLVEKSDEEQEAIIDGWKKRVVSEFAERLLEEGFIDIDVNHPTGEDGTSDTSKVMVSATIYVRKKGAEIHGGKTRFVREKKEE